jgi:hypothetical protein
MRRYELSILVSVVFSAIIVKLLEGIKKRFELCTKCLAIFVE